MSNPDDWRVWLKKAANDLLNINNNLVATTIPWDTVCFHSQQAAEKVLRALLVSRGELVPRTHDLSALLGQCSAAGLVVEAIREDCERLQPYAVLTRYPGSPFEPDENEGRLAAEAARRIEEAVVQLLEPNKTQ
jgi:HEPN domain-containing protein